MKEVLARLGIQENNPGSSTGINWLQTAGSNVLESYSPADGKKIAAVTTTTADEYETIITTAQAAFEVWRKIPAPRRGEIIRQYGNKLREHKEDLGKLVSYEMGKILSGRSWAKCRR
jgi:aldehyde dehydrogenase (NAD+)